MPDRDPDAAREGPRHAADASRRRRISLGRSARLGRGRHRRGDAVAGEHDELAADARAEETPEARADEPAATEPAATEPAAPDPEAPDLDATDGTAAAAASQAAPGGAAADPADRAGDPPVDAAEPDPDPERKSGGRARLKASLSRPGRGQVIAAALLLLFGLAIVTQIRLTTQDSTYANARREDLIQLLDGLNQENRRLEGELGDLERTKTNLQSGADAQQVAREEAERRIEVLSILAGTVPAEGQGIRMTISDPQNKVTAEILLNAIEEMRDAGAEVIEINDSIRLVASSWFGVGPNGQLVVDGMPVTKPITIEVIGDPHSLSEGANFRGGMVSEISSSKVGGSVAIDPLQNVEITSLHTPKPNQYARPASAEPTG